MKLLQPRNALALLSLSIVLAIVLHESDATSPGPLTSVHARVPELVESGSCELCHGESLTEMAAACGECHEAVASQLRSRAGFHGHLAPDESARCGKCHVEHHGDSLKPVDARVFALAGVVDRAQFQHDFVAFGLVGAHARLDCKACHVNADVDVLASGAARFLGLSQRCDSCHEDPHDGRFAQSCDACHGQERPFAELGGFVHTERFALFGVHAGKACADCHEKDTVHSVESVGGRGPRPPERTCADCHASPHTSSFLQALAASVERTVGASCAQCHPTTRAGWDVPGAEFPRELHAASGVVLERPHDKVGCEQCHSGYATEAAFASRFPGRKANDCGACHADPHGGQFVDASGTPQACVSCHGMPGFEPHSFDLARHGQTAFPLEGSHMRVQCDQCHQRDGERPRTFRGTSPRCADCHEDVHGEAFYAAVPGGTQDCQECHATSAFEAEHHFDASTHAVRAAFTLDGAHLHAECERCHVRTPVEDALGRRFGRVARIFGVPPDECSTCHVDVHAGVFDGSSSPTKAGERGSCERCHDAQRFKPLALPFDHSLWTGLALTGAHARAECAACHSEPAPLVNPRAAQLASTRTLGEVRPALVGSDSRACAACHVDVHAGMFDAPGRPERVAGEVGCARCHGVERFHEVPRAEFDHGMWTGFALEGRHAASACEACHVPGPRDASDRAFGRASGSRCSDCHSDPHIGQFASRSCEECHASSEGWGELRFDHARDSRFPLDQNHVQLACATCHRPWPLVNGGTAVRYKPLGTTCVECHGFEKGKG